MTRTISILILVVAAMIAVAASISDELLPTSRLVPTVGQALSVDGAQLGNLEKSLETSGLTGFLKTAQAVAPAGCPTIYSRSYCDRLFASGTKEDKDRAEHAVRVRNLGKRLLQELESVSTKVTLPDLGVPEARTTAEQMLALSEWILKGDGYGNGIIASRCRLLGAVAAAHVVIDESIPVADAGALVGSLKAFGEVEWFKWVVRAHEREAPGALAPFVRKAETPEAIRKSLLLAALRGQALIRDSGLPEDGGRLGRDLEGTRQARLGLAPELAIYLDDPLISSTTLEAWELRRLLPEPLHTRLLDDLDGTVFFRKCVGGFPLQPLPEGAIKDGKLSSFYTSRTHAAFSRAWDDFSTRKEFMNSDLRKDPLTGRTFVDPSAEKLSIKYLNMGLGDTAAGVYEAVRSGRLENYLLGDAPKREK